MKRLLYFLVIGALGLAMGSCTKEIADVATNPYVFSATATTVSEGEDIPLMLTFSDGGYAVDNGAWGDSWKKATFHCEILDSRGRVVETAVVSGPTGVLVEGSRVDIPRSGRLDLVVSSLREGDYTIKINMRTRYTVDTWASTDIRVTEKKGEVPPVVPPAKVLAEWFTVPDKDNGHDVDTDGNIILDLRYFNVTNPYRFTSVMVPENVSDRRIVIDVRDEDILAGSVTDGTTMVLVPKKVGVTRVEAVSGDGAVKRGFGVRVIETHPGADGFSLPTDNDEKGNYDLDVAGRLALDINEWNSSKPFRYTCRPIPDGSVLPGLKAESDTPDVLGASVEDPATLVLTPKKPGYATVTVSTTDGKVIRTMRVAVISNFKILIDAVESEPSEEDKAVAIFPCRLTLAADSKWIPEMMHVETYGKATGRVDLTDPSDYFKVDSLKNARTAFWSFEEKVNILILGDGPSAYDVYKRLMRKVGAIQVLCHHSDDYPDYYDYVRNFKLYAVTLQFGIRQNFDTNIYRGTVVTKYDSPQYRLYQYLH